VIVIHTHDADQVIVKEQGIVSDSMNSTQHSSLVETSTTDLIQCDHRVTPTNEQGTRKDVEDAKHYLPTMDSTHSLRDEDGKEEVINIIPPVESIHKSNRAKNPLSAKRNDFLWST
jgi:hypothetical protein